MAMNKDRILSLATAVVRLLCLLAVVYFVVRCIDAREDDNDIEIEDTPVVIESIKPIGELYAYTAITEDFGIDNVEKVGFFSKSYYKAVQTLRMRVSFVINLDSVEYVQQEDGDTVLVRIPQPRYVQTAQGGNFICEVESPNFDAARVINVVERKIRSKYDTPTNRQKAMIHARDVLAAFVTQCGKVPKFERK